MQNYPRGPSEAFLQKRHWDTNKALFNEWVASVDRLPFLYFESQLEQVFWLKWHTQKLF